VLHRICQNVDFAVGLFSLWIAVEAIAGVGRSALALSFATGYLSAALAPRGTLDTHNLSRATLLHMAIVRRFRASRHEFRSTSRFRAIVQDIRREP